MNENEKMLLSNWCCCPDKSGWVIVYDGYTLEPDICCTTCHHKAPTMNGSKMSEWPEWAILLPVKSVKSVKSKFQQIKTQLDANMQNDDKIQLQPTNFTLKEVRDKVSGLHFENEKNVDVDKLSKEEMIQMAFQPQDEEQRWS